MRAAVIGGGAIGLGTAALLRHGGHEPVLWSPSLAATPGPARLQAAGAVAGTFAAEVAPSLPDAVRGAECVLICLPGWAHLPVFDALAPVVAAGQTVIISSHASLGGLYLRRAFASHGVDVPVVMWGTTIVTGRRTGPLSCTVSNLREKVDAAVMPEAATGDGLALCRSLFGDRFTPRAGLMAIQLSNLNPQNHLAMLLCNLTRAERGEDWGNYWAITPAVGALIEALDKERVAVAQAFGVAVRTVHEHFRWSFGVAMGTMGEMAAAVHARGGAPLGPKTLDTRYITEDVPYGIVVTEVLAGIAGVPAPLHTAGIEMFNALRSTDFRAANPILPKLGLAGMTVAGLRGA